MLKQTKLYGDAATVSEETLSGISIVWAFNGQKQQIQKYNDKLDQVRRASNAAGVKIGVTRGESDERIRMRCLEEEKEEEEEKMVS